MALETECLTVRELALRWKVSIRTIERLRVAQDGPAWFRIGGSIRYRLQDVRAWEAAEQSRP
jgi:hypothetical protein